MVGHNLENQHLHFSCLGHYTFSHCFSSYLTWNMAGEFYVLLLRQDTTGSRSHCWRPIQWRWLLWRNKALPCLSSFWVILCASGDHSVVTPPSWECQTSIWELEGSLVRGWIRARRNRSREGSFTSPCCWWLMRSITATVLLKEERTYQRRSTMVCGNSSSRRRAGLPLLAPVLMPPGPFPPGGCAVCTRDRKSVV